MTHPLIGMPQGAEWLVILAIVILVFGAAKLPDLARGTGQALRIFKDEDETPAAEPRGELPTSTPTDEAPTSQERRTDTTNG
jgi:sec-independent protein translocase protein TatA